MASAEGQMMKNKHIILIALLLSLPLVFFIFYQTSTEIQVINNRDYVPALLNEINKADESIYVAMFSATYYNSYPDSSANQILEALASAKSCGIDVKVIFDEYPEEIEKAVKYLRKNNISVKYDGTAQTTHAKLIIIDSETTILGSSNWRYYSLNRNNEANILIKSRTIAEKYNAYFEEIWSNGNN